MSVVNASARILPLLSRNRLPTRIKVVSLTRLSSLIVLGVFIAVALSGGGRAAPLRANQYSQNAIINAGHWVFGGFTDALASVVETAISIHGYPDAYILGEEVSASFIGGFRYGEGSFHMQGMQPRKIYWQGPSAGFDFGADGDRTMMLVYGVTEPDSILARFIGIDGSAYLVAGAGFTVLANHGIKVVPIRTGLGGRLGININYLKFRAAPTWNPF